MFISDIKRIITRYGSLSFIFLVIVAIYEQFSFGITSFQMRLTIIIPSIFGLIQIVYITLFKHTFYYKTIFDMAMITFLIVCFFYGVLEIYGTTSSYLTPLYILGYILSAIGIILMIVKR